MARFKAMILQRVSTLKQNDIDVAYSQGYRLITATRTGIGYDYIFEKEINEYAEPDNGQPNRTSKSLVCQ